MRTKKIHSAYILVMKPEDKQKVANHLRYWPYVKYYYFINETTIRMGAYLGNPSRKEQGRLFRKTRRLVRLCLRQYEAEVSQWKRNPEGMIPSFSDNLFVRPDHALKPFTDFFEGNGDSSEFLDD